MKSTVFAKIFDIIITLVVCFVIVVAFIWFVHSFNVFKLPGFIEEFFDDGKSLTVQDKSESDLIQILETQQLIDGEYEYVSLTVEKAVEMLSSISVVDNYIWEVETSVSYEGNTRSQLHRIYKKGSSVRIDTLDGNQSFTTVLSNDIAITIDNDTGEMAELGSSTDYLYTNIVNVSALDNFLKSDSPDVTDVAVVNFEENKYLYVVIPKNKLSGFDKYLVSLNSGLVLYASSEVNGNEYFNQRTAFFDSSSIISDKAFDINSLITTEQLTLR